jgi:hypothetical protein
MPEGESGPEIQKSTPEQEPKAKKEITEEKQLQITWSEIHELIQPGPDGRQAVNNPWLNRLAKLLSVANPPRLTPESLQRWLDQGDEKYVAGELPEEEWALVAGTIQKKMDELVAKKTEAEPEIRRLERPKTPEEAVNVFLREIFDLHERGLRENKQWEKAGEFYSEYTTLQRWVEDIDPGWGKEFISYGVNKRLADYLAAQFPEGIRLKEKLTLLLEAMKRLHNRQIEVERAGGSLEKLGVGKVEEATSVILQVPFTNIRPLDWYVLFHIDELFPESSSPEAKIDLQEAWNLWKGIGENPYDEAGNLRKITIGGWQSKYTLKDIFTSERVMAEVRATIAREIGKKVGGLIAGSRAESLAHSIFTAGLTFDMWDRERWKMKGEGEEEARDLMWFDYKRLDRFSALRPAGPWNTVGRFWADEGLYEKTLGEIEKRVKEGKITKEEGERRKKYVEENRGGALFLVKRNKPSRGTIIGDFWSSTVYLDKREIPHRLCDEKEDLKKIPWLEPGKFEEEVYEGYFTYSLYFAAKIANYISQREWKPDALREIKFWEGLADTTLRLAHFCPWLISRRTTRGGEDIITKALEEARKLGEKERVGKFRKLIRELREIENGKIILKFRRILAEGIFWTGSYLARANPDAPFVSGTFSKDDVYGKSLLGVFKAEPGILEVIEQSGFLDGGNLEILRRKVYEFNFHLKGRPA